MVSPLRGFEMKMSTSFRLSLSLGSRFNTIPRASGVGAGDRFFENISAKFSRCYFWKHLPLPKALHIHPTNRQNNVHPCPV